VAASFYWIGAQTMVAFDMPAEKYNNFGGIAAERAGGHGNGNNIGGGGKRRMEEFHGCAAMAASGQIKWINRDCYERHGFICQI